VVTQVVPALAFSLLLVPLAYTGRRVGRLEGGMLLAAYGGFLAWIL
jgi:Ca2+/Na+ antiporter